VADARAGEILGEHWVMRRKLVAVVVGGAIAGAVSALVALAAFTGHGATADGGQPSTLLESASGSGGANLATAPSWPGQTGGGSSDGGSGTVAGRVPNGGGSVVVQGGAPQQGSAPSGGGQSSGGGGGDLPVTLPGLPAGGVSGSVTATVPTVTTTSTSAAVTSSQSSSSSSSSAASTSTTTTSTTTTRSSTQLLCWLLGKLLPC
jgi:hypothetical protein